MAFQRMRPEVSLRAVLDAALAQAVPLNTPPTPLRLHILHAIVLHAANIRGDLQVNAQIYSCRRSCVVVNFRGLQLLFITVRTMWCFEALPGLHSAFEGG
ncbi:hypothetical protein C7974DRAFT_230968 [Boeremia exigua]|uniref:uncharacterized protein n=1 Tax=Boeremia exigua TaxID=749465 RepID=UPI001E8E11F4|nr:uncharacterized protein C7974DRAFT_230968 [Boeremia exigua]KAH6620307.1 hypothetical protein C7974DRAFT_230968 [Boeremia exigua]